MFWESLELWENLIIFLWIGYLETLIPRSMGSHLNEKKYLQGFTNYSNESNSQEYKDIHFNPILTGLCSVDQYWKAD